MQIPPAGNYDHLNASSAKAKATRSETQTTTENTRPTKASPAVDVPQVLQHEAATLSSPAINTGKLDDLKFNLDGIVTSLDGAKESFLDQAFGPGHGDSARVGSTLDQLKGMGGSGNSKNPLDAAMHANVAGGGAGHAMQDAGNGTEGGAESQESTSTWDAVKNWFSSVFSSAAGNPAAKTPGGNAGGAAAGTAYSVLTANTESPEAKANEFRGWASFVQLSRGEYYHPGMKDVDDPFDGNDQIPTPEGDSGPQRIITRDDLRGISARLGGTSEPVDDGVGSGGPINEGASGPGQVAQQAEFVDNGATQNVTLNSTLLKGVEAKLTSKINPPQ